MDDGRPADGPTVTVSQDSDTRWISFADLAARRGISRASASKLVRRHGWRRQTDNQGHVLILVPVDALDRPTDRPSPEDDGRPAVDTPDSPLDRPTDTGALVAALALAERAERQADEANKRADVAVALADRTLAQLTDANARVDQTLALLAEATTRADRFRDERDQARTNAQEARQAADQLRHERDSAEADTAQLREAMQKAEHDRAAALSIADEAVRAAEELRQTQAKRVGQGRWARLRAAWRNG
jgi:hypothetical protein